MDERRVLGYTPGQPLTAAEMVAVTRLLGSGAGGG